MIDRQKTSGLWRSRRRGQIAPLFALTLVIFIGSLMLGVDLVRLRAEAQNAQRAANAAALAGVIYMPDFQANAYSRAQAEARKNGFIDGQNGVQVTTSPTNQSNQLKVTISEPVSLVFGGVLGLGSQTINRSAVAEYFQPLQMGSPDNVIGYAPYPTTMVNPPAPEGFYLENKGPYTYKESGDAYTPLYESYAGKSFLPSGNLTTPGNPCTLLQSDGTCKDSAGNKTVLNQDHFTNPPFNGYNYIVDDPAANTLVIKIFNPYDESFYNSYAQAWDSNHIDPKTGHHVAYAPSDSTDYIELGAKSTKNAAGQCVMSVGSGCTKLIDSTDDSGGGGMPFKPSPVTLQFSLYGPAQSAYTQNWQQITKSINSGTSTSTTSSCITTAQNCVWVPTGQTNCGASSFCGGNDPATCNATTCTPSQYAFKFMNYAIIHGPGIFRINVNSVANADGFIGTRGHAYGLAVCDAAPSSPPAGYSADLGASSDPFTNQGATPGWDPNSCVDPNGESGTPCVNRLIASSSTNACVHIYGQGRMAIHNWIADAAGSTTDTYALIPLGYIPPEYAGKTLKIRLYDVGDIGGSGNDYIEPLTPAGDPTHLGGSTNSTTYKLSGGGTATSPQFPDALPYSFTSTADDTGTGKQYGYTSNPSSGSYDCGTKIAVTHNGASNFEADWLTIQVPLLLSNNGSTNPSCLAPTSVSPTPTYKDMVGYFGGYWKMLYDVAPGNSANDATTWEISIAGTPVHLVTG